MQSNTMIIAEKASTFALPPTIVIFDSGVGGLSVYDEVRQLLPNARYIFAFDNAGFPYGEKPAEQIILRTKQFIEQIVLNYSVDLVVIACNTASTVVLPTLRKHFPFPIVGVVPAIKPAVKLTRNGVIGLLATRATINRQYTHDLINQFATHCKVELIGSARLVELAEEKLHKKPISHSELTEIVLPWLALAKIPDTIVLGCTHFPLLKTELQTVLPTTCQFIDSGTAIARRVYSLLEKQILTYITPVIEENIAICTRADHYAARLDDVLANYGFNTRLEYLLK